MIPEQPLQGCEGGGNSGASRGQPFQDAALQAPLVPGGLAVGMGRYRRQAIGWRRRGVIGRSRLPGRWGRNCAAGVGVADTARPMRCRRDRVNRCRSESTR